MYAGFAIRDALWKATKGQIYFEYIPFSMLGSEREVLNQLQQGTIQGMSVSSGAAPNLGPRMGLVNLPFLINTYEKLEKFIANKKLYKHFLAGMEHQGIIGLDITGYGQYGWATTVPVKTIADAEKVKFRIAALPMNKMLYKVWGFNPVLMPWPEVSTALKQGVITGLDHTLLLYYLTKKFEMAHNFTPVNYAQGLFIWILNKAWFESLPKDLQKIFRQVVAEQCKIYRAQTKTQEENCKRRAIAQGVRFWDFSPADIAELRRRAEVVYSSYRSAIGPKYLAAVQASLKDRNVQYAQNDSFVKQPQKGTHEPVSKHQTNPSGGTPASRVAGVRPRLFVLAVGVSRYRQPGLSLRYAAADARSFARALRRQPNTLFSAVRTRVLTDRQVTRENILTTFTKFFGRAVSDDVVVIFMAGHGVKSVASGSYYFLPWDASPDNLLLRGLAWHAFDEAVARLRRRVRNLVLVLDTCHAGGLQVAMRGIAVGHDLAVPFKRRGIFVLAAAQPEEEAEERPAWRHGAFTRALLSGLEGKADFDRDQKVDVVELFKYVERAVSEMTEGRQHPHYRMSGGSLPLKALP